MDNEGSIRVERGLRGKWWVTLASPMRVPFCSASRLSERTRRHYEACVRVVKGEGSK